MKANVERIVYRDSYENEPILFDKGVFMKKHLTIHARLFGDENPSDITTKELSLELTLGLGKCKYKRDGKIACSVDSVDVVEERKMTPLCVPLMDSLNLNVLESHSKIKRININIAPVELKKKLLELIPEIEMSFYLSEDELIHDVRMFLENEYPNVNFKRHVEIDGCIIDGLAFVGSDYIAKIIGFEVKTDRDVFNRLYNQLDSYLTICDEVYLVIQSKKLPKDLPFYVGIFAVENGVLVRKRKATSLKHSINVNDCWKTLLKNLSTHAGIKRDSDLIGFFQVFENIKRKLIWNQFVVGFHQSYAAEYIPLTDNEKRLVRCFFGSVEKMDKVDTAFRTLFDFPEK